jgi:hypothetical protein
MKTRTARPKPVGTCGRVKEAKGVFLLGLMLGLSFCTPFIHEPVKYIPENSFFGFQHRRIYLDGFRSAPRLQDL